MRPLIELYDEIYQDLGNIAAQIAEKEEQIRGIDARRSEEIPLRIANLKESLEKIDEYELKIDGFRQLAEKSLESKNVPTIEAPPGYRVNLNRLRSWSMMIDPTSTNDVYAQRVYMVCLCDKCFLEKKRQEFLARIAELDAEQSVDTTKDIQKLQEEIDKIKANLQQYLVSDKMRAFAKAVKEENAQNTYSAAPEKFFNSQLEENCFVPGAYGASLVVDAQYRGLLKDALGEYYDEETCRVFLPVEDIPTDKEFAMMVSCVPARNRVTEMDAGIRNLLFHVIHNSPAGERDVYIFDAMRQNSALEGTLKQLEGSFALHSVPKNKEQLESGLEELISSFSDKDDVLEDYDTLSEYNAAMPQEKKLSRSVVVLVGWPECFDGKTQTLAKRIIQDYERYGISFIAVNVGTKKEKDHRDSLGISEYIGENIIRIDMNNKDATIAFGNKQPHKFIWYTFKHTLSEAYVTSVREHKMEKKTKGNAYPKRVDLINPPAFTSGKKSICVPYGVDGKDEIHEIAFGNENFAAFLMGASGSGKSTLLHTIITGILRDYHPDDVELWLADFKMSEFAQYMDPVPPHVKYILLDESQELVYDLIDKLTEKMMERQRFFMQHRDLKKVENVPNTIYMPVIFVILDEFSIMSQAVAESEVYKLKLQNILAKGRALGIKFIFSSQTFVRGIAGLTQTAKDQIQMRIAMKNTYDEIDKTLELTSNVKTEQVRNWMDALPPHYVLLKYRDGDYNRVKRLQVMYFPGDGEAALEPQKNLIRYQRRTMRSVEQDDYSSDIATYVNKHPVLVDGNSFKPYDPEKIAELRQQFIADGNEEYAEDMLLSLGDPRRMTEAIFVPLSNESRENILLVARAAESACAMSVVMSVTKQFEAAGGTVHVWAYIRNRMYHAYKNDLFSAMDVTEGSEAVSLEILALKEKIMNKEAGNDLYILLGMEQICGDFEFMEKAPGASSTGRGKSTLGAKAPDKEKLDSLQAKTEEEIKDLEAMHEDFDDIQAAIDKMTLEKIELGWDIDEIEKEMNRMLEEHNKKIRARIDAEKAAEAANPAAKAEGNADGTGTSVDSSQVPNAQGLAGAEDETLKEDEGPVPYNALEDFGYILAQGSRWGYHFLLSVNNISDLKMAGAKIQLFSHRLAFQISGDDSITVFASKIASKLPEHICQYSNSIEKYSFRPYLHPGIEWDGWGIDEQGRVINPADIIV